MGGTMNGGASGIGRQAALLAQKRLDQNPMQMRPPQLSQADIAKAAAPAGASLSKDIAKNREAKEGVPKWAQALSEIGGMASSMGGQAQPEAPRMEMPQGMFGQMAQNQNPQLMAIMQQMMAARQGQQYQPRAMLGNPDMLRHLRGR